MDIVVGIGEYAISNNGEDIIRTYALGSCIALTVYSPRKRVLGMVHIALPDSSINPEVGKEKPGHFADIAIPFLLNKISSEYGCEKDELIFNIYGGAKSMQPNDVFRIGKRNIDATVKFFISNNITFSNLEIGGFISRTIEADVISGSVKMSTYPMKI